MKRLIQTLSIAMLAGALAFAAQFAHANQPSMQQDVLRSWYKLVLQLVRHTATYTPPVASRSFAYLGVTVFEAQASGSGTMRSLAGQLNGFTAVPAREAGKAYDEAIVLQAALAAAVLDLFGNTGPTGQRSIAAQTAKLQAKAATGRPADVVARSEAYGKAVAEHVLAWSRTDGGAKIDNLGFPQVYDLRTGKGNWVPTNLIALQQKPLLPNWGKNRSFAMPNGASCPLPPPPAYSEEPTSEFYKQAQEVVEAKKNLTDEQKKIARFWSDDPMLSPTPPGHWISIALQIIERDQLDANTSADILARVSIAMADAFIGCWQSKYEYDLLRPLTYIRRVIDPKWEPLINTPPFPEYPSGHSTQSGAAAVVLTSILGENFAFEDATHQRDGLAPRSFASFWAAADEAGISRLYGGIHFRAAIERGLEQGRCVGAYAAALKTGN